MNILTHDTAYAFFPRATFEDRIALSLSNRKPSRNEPALMKYKNRGWTIYPRISRVDLSDPAFLFAPKLRYVGDPQCWKMTIFPIFQPDQSCRHDVELNSWRTNYNNFILAMSYEVVTSPCLQSSYLIESGDENLTEWLEMEIDSELDEYEADGPRCGGRH